MALETALNIRASIEMWKDLFVSSQKICDIAFNSYWPTKERNRIKVMSVMKIDLKDKIVLEHRTALIQYFHFMLLQVWELERQSKTLKRQNHLVTIDDNCVGSECT